MPTNPPGPFGWGQEARSHVGSILTGPAAGVALGIVSAGQACLLKLAYNWPTREYTEKGWICGLPWEVTNAPASPAHLFAELSRRGFELRLFGPLAGEEEAWPHVAQAVAQQVAAGQCEQGILCCWTGTGVSIAANKVLGVRAALCSDAETARGARKWNDANVLCLSLRLTSETVAGEILDAWFGTESDPSEAANISYLNTTLDRRVDS